MKHSGHNEPVSARRREELIEQFAISPDAKLREQAVAAIDHALAVEGGENHRPHGLDVAAILLGLHVDQTTLVAAILSDPRLRDRLDERYLREHFGDTVAALVKNVNWLNTFKECRDDENIQAPEQAERLRRMLLAMVDDVRAVLIKLAFRVQRLRGLAHEDYETRRCIARETLEIYSPLANRLGVGQLKWEMEDLAFRYLEPQAYKQIAKSLEETRTGREAYVQEFMTRLVGELEREGIEAEVSGRPKHIYSIWRKMQRKHLDLDELYDLRAVRVIVDKVPTCYGVLGIVHGLWPHIPREFDDYIANPKENGYQSLHTAVVGPGGRTVEVQIRTREMHEFAELGVAAHWRYKEGGAQDQKMERAIASLRHLLEERDSDAELLDDFRSDLFSDRVFVLTPQGEIMDLKRGATPLDFAYAVHTEVGHRCRGAKVNGRIVPLTHVLKSGEQVEILTAKEGEPSRDWLNPHTGYLATSGARAKVRQWFKQRDQDKNLADGRHLLEREAQRLGIAPKGIDLDQLAQDLRLQRGEELLIALGRGDVTPGQLLGALKMPEPEADEIVISRPDKRVRRKRGEAGEVRVRGVGNLLTHMAPCCKPVPGDAIVGYITRGKGVSIHRRDCPNILGLPAEKRPRLVEVEWGEEAEARPVDVHVQAFDRQGLLRDITSVLANEKVNVLAANTRTDRSDQSVHMDLTIEITGTTQLGLVMDKIAQLPNVMDVYRRVS
ncbi:MAG TPA: GTP diphosphokinase [Thioalkalivibrio sp.]|nr:GTP diphosphokinase [Thioalkalivibrio sp.]